jgi:biotin carboxylase
MRPRVAVLHDARSFFPVDLNQAIGEQVEVIWVLTDAPGGGGAVRRLLSRMGTVVDLAGLDLDEAARVLGQHRPEGIVTFVDSHLVIAAELAARLDLIYHTPAVAGMLADKRLQRAALEQAGVPGPRYWPVPAGITPTDLDELATRVRYPAVLKRARGSGSREMHPVAHAHDLKELLGGTIATGGIDRLLEEYLHDDPGHDPSFGSYLSVESVVGDGQTIHVAITGRFPLAEPFRETGNFIPAIVPARLRGALLSMVDDAISALGIATGVIHTEIKLTPEGPRLIEVNGRLAARPPFILQRVAGVNLFLGACLLALGAPPGLSGPARCSGVGYWLMLQPPMSARRIAAIEGIKALAAAPEVDTVRLNRRPGEAVDWREGTDGHVATVRGRASDQGALVKVTEFINRTMKIDYE